MRKIAAVFILLAVLLSDSFGAEVLLFQEDFTNFPNGWSQWCFWGSGNWQVDNTRNRSWPVGVVSYGLNNGAIPNIELNTVFNFSPYDLVLVEWYSYSNYCGMSPGLYYYTDSWIRQDDTVFMFGDNNTWIRRMVAIPTNATRIMFSSTIQCYWPEMYHSIDDLKIYGERKPVLSWTGEPNYTNSGAYPCYAKHNTEISFRVKRSDADNDNSVSGFPRVVIRQDGGFPTRIIPLTHVSGDNLAGAVYSTSTVLAPSPYAYTYSFEDNDGWLSAATALGTIIIDNEPSLNWTGEPDYQHDGLADASDSGYVSMFATATFRIRYSDSYLFPIASTSPVITIFRDGCMVVRSTMAFVSGSAEKNYQYSIRLPTGTYQYSFSAQSSRLYAQGIPTSSKTFSVIYPATHIRQMLPIEGDIDHSGYFVSIHPDKPRFEIQYIDPYSCPLSSGYPRLNIQSPYSTGSYPMTHLDGSRYGYEFSYVPSTGVWRYWFTYKNDYHSEEYSSLISSFVVSKAPEDIKITGITDNGYSTTSRVRISWEIDNPEAAAPGIRQAINSGLTFELYFGDDPGALTLVYKGTDPFYEVTRLKASKTYYWKVNAANKYGVTLESPVYLFSTISVPDHAFNYPNPFRAGSQATNIVFDMPEDGSAAIAVYSEFGERIFETSLDNLQKGTQQYAYDGKDAASRVLFSGPYMCIITKKYSGKEAIDKCRLLVVR